MKVAIIGGGISGLMVADQLNGQIDYTLYEQANYLGGHADTQHVEVDGKSIHVDTGFIVYNQDVYKNFNAMLVKYGVDSIPSDMSFAVSNRVTGLEYNATSIKTLFCQKSNIFNPKFYRMIWDIKRFYGHAQQLLLSDTKIGVYEYLTRHNYSDYFINEHIIPMVSALWSGDFDSVRDYPLVFMLKFMQNHQMLQLNKRPEWRTIKNGSKSYVKAIADHIQGEVKLNTAVKQVKRTDRTVEVITDEGSACYDQVVFATHTDIALKLLTVPSADEQQALGGIPYVENHMDLHTDASLLPANKKAWASWSVNRHEDTKPVCTVNYYMNLLQSLECETPVIVSLNQNEYIGPEHILMSKKYQHPIYTRATLQAQQRIKQLQGQNNSYYCGAYLGWGFHEDGARSGVEVAELLKADL